MIYRIYPQDSQTLLEKPETGMGYQVVIASRYQRYLNKKFVIYNTDLAVELDSDFLVNKRRIMNEGYSNVLRTATELMLETDSISILDYNDMKESTIISSIKKNTKGRHSGGKGAVDCPKEKATGSETFVRLSAFENDKRIDFQNRCLKPGTFTTTYRDYRVCVDTNDAPVDRYALPNEDKIQWSFYVRPNTNDFLQRGIVQPAFGKDGGGIEGFFENGTSQSTYLSKRNYGQ